MKTEDTQDFDNALWEVEQMMESLPSSTGGNAWATLLAHCKEDGTVSQKYVDPLEKVVIPKFLSSLNEETKRELWQQTEVGMMESGGGSDIMLGSIELDLEVALFEAMLERAFDAAETRQP